MEGQHFGHDTSCTRAMKQACKEYLQPYAQRRTTCYWCLQGLDWFWEMLKLVLASAVPPHRALPKIVFYEHLSHLSRDTWLGFETALVIHNRSAPHSLLILKPAHPRVMH